MRARNATYGTHQIVGDYAWREDLYDRVDEQLGEKTKAGAIASASAFTQQMLPNLERAMNHPNMTEELRQGHSFSHLLNG